LAARSVYYGILLYLSATVAGLWGIVAYPSFDGVFFIVARCGRLRGPEGSCGLCRDARDDKRRLQPTVVVSFAMPDIWLSSASPVLYFHFGNSRPSRVDYALLTIVVGAAAAFHLIKRSDHFFVDADSVARRKIFWPSERADFRNFRAATVGLALAIALGWGFSAAAARHFGSGYARPFRHGSASRRWTRTRLICAPHARLIRYATHFANFETSP